MTKANKNHHKCPFIGKGMSKFEKHHLPNRLNRCKMMQTTFSYTHTVHLEHPEVHGFHQNLPTCCKQESIIVWDPRLSKHDQDNSHFVSNRPEDDLFNVSFTIKPIRDSIRRCCKGYFCDFRRRKSSQIRSSSWPTSVPPRSCCTAIQWMMRACWLSREA